MIYVTVGTHEQQFDRLIECVDTLKGKGIIDDEVVIQNGFSKYPIQNCRHKDFFDHEQMLENYKNAGIIIMHGGPSSIMRALQLGRIPIVVPRQKKFHEHVNDHQLEFCRAVAQRYHNIILIEDIGSLEEAIRDHDKLTAGMKADGFGNNAEFVRGLEKIIDGLW
ncbi:MAG: multidrug MFS transporter [Lachnospiraceae bacterium]|nr:multidrug MFS transporter [Lachnospiraceae bacterium]